MSDVYSPVLGVSLAFLAGALVCLLAARVSRSRHLLRLGRVGAVLALVALTVAVVSHVRLGHTPGGEAALGPAGFIAAHPMVATVAIAAVGLLGWSFRDSGNRGG